MEMSFGACSQAKITISDSLKIQNVGFCNSIFLKKNQILFDLNRNRNESQIRFGVKAMAVPKASQLRLVADDITLVEKCLPADKLQLFVGLPMNTISDCNTINHIRAITAGLKALKLLGVEGVELPVWWGIVEKEAMGKYQWSGYFALAKLVQAAGLKLRVSLCFHGSKDLNVRLPQWISKIGETQPDIFFSDRSGNRYRECLSFGVDDLPVLQGKSPMQVYESFLESFSSTFSDFMGSTITDVTVGLGPSGELQYPSFQTGKSGKVSGAGEFQCYDKYLLNNLKQHAQETGNINWGLGGPHDAPACYDPPNYSSFFKDIKGSWETQYGDFFLSWYSNQLALHGERVLSLASTIFSDSSINISGKVPLLHSWYKMKSHPAEVTAGYYNTIYRDGYDCIAKLFARNSCRVILPGMELSDKTQPEGLLSSPQLLLSEIKKACRNHGVKVYGENSKLPRTQNGMDQIKQNLTGDNVRVDLFTYQRMGAYLFSPDHFPAFTEFVRSLSQSDLLSDDLPEDAKLPLTTVSKPTRNLKLQEA